MAEVPPPSGSGAGAFWEQGPGQRVERDRRLLAAIVDSAEEAIVSVDLAGTITSWNAGAVALYGHRAADAVGTSLATIFPPGSGPEEVLAAIRAGRRWTHPGAERRRLGGAVVTVAESYAPVRAGDGTVVGAASISRDVTEAHRAAAALAAARAEVEETNRQLARSNAELEQFAYIASHDLSEPLRAVAGMVQLLGRRYRGRLDDDADEFIDFATEGCERLRSMIEDILTYSRVGRAALVPAPVDLAAVVDEVVASLGAQIGAARATVAVGPLPEVRGDRHQLVQLLQNLLSNAVKFARPDRPSHVVVSATATAGGGWRVEVADDGIGIEPQYRERIFRMFQRLHVRDAYPGSGIGLAVAARIVERHGGNIGVGTRPGGGSTFWFELPGGGSIA